MVGQLTLPALQKLQKLNRLPVNCISHGSFQTATPLTWAANRAAWHQEQVPTSSDTFLLFLNLYDIHKSPKNISKATKYSSLISCTCT